MEPEEHIAGIFKEYTTPSRVLRSFTNLSNTVIQTALSGQNKFIFELLQNADDAYDEGLTAIEMTFILDGSYLIVQHNGKGFDYNDVERICDYASQIEEVKANDLSKTGYKGLGFKSLFNLSDCIYICSNGYKFRFDKNHWPDPESKPWQVIPILCVDNELPLQNKYSYSQRVNIILKVNKVKLLEEQLIELIEQPDLLLFLHRINKMKIRINENEFCIERLFESFGNFKKISFLNNQVTTSCWLIRTFQQSVPSNVRNLIQGGSQFVYPEKIKKATEIPLTFALKCDNSFQELIRIDGLCFSTLPTQLYLSLPYHLNSSFILNLDRTQLHENEWNEFLIKSIGYLQLSLLKDLAETEHLKNHVIEFLVRQIYHQFNAFCRAFLENFNIAKKEIRWLPSYKGSGLLKFGEAWTDDIDFFRQKFEAIYDDQICPYLIDYNVNNRNSLLDNEAKHFTYEKLLDFFRSKYRHQLNQTSYSDFISYLYERISPYTSLGEKLKSVSFLRAKDGAYLSPVNALLESNECPIPDYFMLNPVDNNYLPTKNHNDIKNWLSNLGAFNLNLPIKIVQKSILQWIYCGNLRSKINQNNHDQIIKYMAKHAKSFTRDEINMLKENFIVLTQDRQFRLANNCFVPDATTIEELADVISDSDKISGAYDMDTLRDFFVEIGVYDRLNAIDVLRKSLLFWIKSGIINSKLTLWNYNPIIKFFANYYPQMKYKLTADEIEELRNTPILTCDQNLKEAQTCYFPSALPKCEALACAIAKSELVFTEKVSVIIINFLKEIGVSSYMSPLVVLQKTVIKWIKENQTSEKITKDNHDEILAYIAEEWDIINKSLTSDEKKVLKQIPLLTKSGTFRRVSECYLFTSACEIPKLTEIITDKEQISDHYFTNKEQKSDHYFTSENAEKTFKLKRLFNDLGIKHPKFSEIYEKYSDHLSAEENVKWFFSKLTTYWENKTSYREKNKISSISSPLLMYIKEKFKSSPILLAQNQKMFPSTSLYSFKFNEISKIDPDSLPILNYDKLPEELEEYLCFKSQIELPCIMKLLDAVNKDTKLGDSAFFKVILEQLKIKPKKDIENYQLCLLSEANKLVPAKNLYYFEGEAATCKLQSHYLKRISGMSHKDTLELAKLCGVNILPFSEEVQKVDGKSNNALKEFYLSRLPFIVYQESKKLNKSHADVLKCLYDEVCSLKLLECKQIHLKYPFGEPTKYRYHFDGLNLYVTGEWMKQKYNIHDHLRQTLSLNTNIKHIIDMEPHNATDREIFLEDFTEDERIEFKTIEDEFLTISGKKVLVESSVISHSEQRNINHDNNIEQQQDSSVVQRQSNQVVPQAYYRRGNRRRRPHRQFRCSTTVRITEVTSVSSSDNYEAEEPDDGSEADHFRKLSEELVFNYLQDYYKNKHPNLRFELQDGLFSIGEGSNRIEISMLSEDAHSFGILLKKNGEIDELIEVEVSSAAEDSTFQLSCNEFLDKISQLNNTIFYLYKEKFHIYYIFCSNKFSVLSDELENPVLFKISPLKI